MSTAPEIKRISLAVENTAYEDVARQMCANILPSSEITVYPLSEFAYELDGIANPDELKVLMLHADQNGLLESGSPIIRSLMSTHVPVLVTRWNGQEPAPVLSINRIVVPLDGSMVAGQAIPIASRVARALNVPVRFVMVIDPSRVIPPAYVYDPDAWGMIEELRETSHWALSQAEASMRNDGVSVGSDLLFGPTNASLLAAVGEGDLVVMTTHGPSRPGTTVRDSVTMRTLVSISQPMLIQQASTADPIVVDGYQACSWAEPLHRNQGRIS